MDIIRKELLKNKDPCMNYVGIGSAINIYTKKEDETLDIEPKNNHENPICIQNIKNNFPFIKIQSVLFDPGIKNYPIIIQKKLNKLDENWINSYHDTNFDIFVNELLGHKIFVIRLNIFYGKNIKNNYKFFDINDFLEFMIEYSIKTFGCFIFNDYTGYNFYKYSLYIYNKYKSHLNRIIIGIGFQTDSGCFPPLDQDHCQISAEYNLDYGITLFNPYLIDSPELYTYYFEKSKLKDNFNNTIINAQLINYIKYWKSIIINILFPAYRLCLLFEKGEDVKLNFKNYIEIIDDYFQIERSKYNLQGIQELIIINIEKLLSYMNLKKYKENIVNIIINDKDPYIVTNNINIFLSLLIDDYCM